MSRIMLAFKKITGDYDEIPTMIFDEIDSGISGITASVVGHKLREIAKTHQIICITHLPQIAAFGEHNYKIDKQTDDAATHTNITELTSAEKIQEIARLLGGATITDTTIRSAEELNDVVKYGKPVVDWEVEVFKADKPDAHILASNDNMLRAN